MMARYPRLHYFDAMYHVMLRGNYRQNIFSVREDYLYFYKLLEEVTDLYECKVHLFCLMTNHVHLVIQVGQIPLSKILQKISCCYAKRHNKLLKRQGHLFQGRYKAKVVQSDDYLLELCYYIHRNPLVAGMVKSLNNYPWSSHLNYSHIEELSWLTTDEVEALLKKYVNSDAIEKYSDFINDEERSLRKHFCLFDEDGLLQVNNAAKTKTVEEFMRTRIDLGLGQICEIISNFLNVEMSRLSDEYYDRKTTLARNMIAYFGHYHAGHYIKDIAFVLNKKPSSVSRALHRELKRGEQVKNLIKTLERELYKITLSEKKEK